MDFNISGLKEDLSIKIYIFNEKKSKHLKAKF